MTGRRTTDDSGHEKPPRVDEKCTLAKKEKWKERNRRLAGILSFLRIFD